MQHMSPWMTNLLAKAERYAKTDLRYLFQNGFWLVVGQGVAIVLGLAVSVAFGHFASQDTYGNYKYVL